MRLSAGDLGVCLNDQAYKMPLLGVYTKCAAERIIQDRADPMTSLILHMGKTALVEKPSPSHQRHLSITSIDQIADMRQINPVRLSRERKVFVLLCVKGKEDISDRQNPFLARSSRPSVLEA